MADLTADHIVRHLDLAGCVIMKKPPAHSAGDNPGRRGFSDARAGCFWLESRWDSRIGQILIQPVGWAEASRNAKAIFARLA